jgi:hypothetical protein
MFTIGEQMYYAKETPREELIEFIESLNTQQFKKIEEFFSDLPKLEKKIEMRCMKCGFQHSLDVQGLRKFFRITFGHENLRNYYKTNFSLMQHHKYSLTELENMMQWERDIYIVYVDAIY